jgi:hypothetical protein
MVEDEVANHGVERVEHARTNGPVHASHRPVRLEQEG